MHGKSANVKILAATGQERLNVQRGLKTGYKLKPHLEK